MFDLVWPAVVRAIIYFLPWAAGALFAWLAANGIGVWNEATGTYVLTVTTAQIVGFATVFLGAPTLALAALLKGWKAKAS